jgi:hypothetical protein
MVSLYYFIVEPEVIEDLYDHNIVIVVVAHHPRISNPLSDQTQPKTSFVIK